MFDDDPRDIEPTYSPLLGAEVPVALLHVYFCENHKWNPAFDEHDEVIEALVTDTERDLCDRITRPGRYRVVARDPHKQFILRRRDIILRPRRRPGVTPQPAPAPHSDAIIDLYKHQVKVAEEARVKAEDALREERQRSDARIDAMRKEHQAHLEALRGQLDAEREKYRVADGDRVEAQAHLDNRVEQVTTLQAQIDEMKADVAKAQALTAELKKKAEDNEFSPLDAIMQMDQALDVLGKTAERFGG